jgi:alkane 1-monooxygenase
MNHWRALKYLLAFTAPLLVYYSFEWEGILTFAPLIYSFFLIPLFELMFPPLTTNLTHLEEEFVATDPIYNLLLYISVPVQYFILWTFLNRVAVGGYFTYELIAYTLSMGLMCGLFGINIAHELGHRNTWYEKTLSKCLLLSALYMHFYIEHNRGHHKRVATPEDPASARYGETVYHFWLRSIWFSYWSAWNIEKKRLKRNKQSFISIHNEMIIYLLLKITLFISIYQVFGGFALMCFIGAAITGILLLETVNYIEHYGLSRKVADSGNYERVMHHHSWNSDHILGRLILFELSRHSDHHYKASKHYQLLRHLDHSPQMPTGYPGMMLISLIPPLWFYVIHKEIEKQSVLIPELKGI